MTSGLPQTFRVGADSDAPARAPPGHARSRRCLSVLQAPTPKELPHRQEARRIGSRALFSQSARMWNGSWYPEATPRSTPEQMSHWCPAGEPSLIITQPRPMCHSVISASVALRSQ